MLVYLFIFTGYEEEKVAEKKKALIKGLKSFFGKGYKIIKLGKGIKRNSRH
jgi:predicted GNAT superfamily acetyltransferase